MAHLLGNDALKRPFIEAILNKASHFLTLGLQCSSHRQILRGKTVANLFLEPSTRTRISFELAAKRLGADVVNFEGASSSMQKGETLLDTFQTLEAMECNAVILRHQEAGCCAFLAQHTKSDAVLINAGEGTLAHPTQALLDLLTIHQNKKTFEGLSCAILGDVANSRVAHSQILGLRAMGVQDIRVIAPEFFLDKDFLDAHQVVSYTSLREGMEGVDVITVLRIQQERLAKRLEGNDLRAYSSEYALTESKLAFAKPGVIVMHPGPMNRGVEIDEAVAEGPHARIQEQVFYGVATRMAVLTYCLS